MRISWTPDNEHPDIERLTVAHNGLLYIIPGYTKHATDDTGKMEAEKMYMQRLIK